MRKATSILLLLTYLILAVTGIQLALPHDKGARPSVAITESGVNTHKAIEKAGPPFYPKGLHEWAGYLFILAGVVHIYLNRTAIQSYIMRTEGTPCSEKLVSTVRKKAFWRKM